MRGVGRGTSDLALDVAALVAEASLPLAQLLLRRRLRLQEALHRLHRRSDPIRAAAAAAAAGGAPVGSIGSGSSGEKELLP